MFILYNESGAITGTISGPGPDYGDVLDQQNRTWMFLAGANNIDPRTHYIDVATKAVRANDMIMLGMNKVQFSADGIDEVKITGIPLGANITILCNTVPYAQIIANDTELEFASDQPAIYDVYVSCARYMPTHFQLEAKQWPAST